MPQLSREPAAKSPPPEKPKANPYGTSLVRVEDPFKKMANKNIHPFSSLLSEEDLDDCDWLEHAAFDSIEAASREKVSEHFRHLSKAFHLLPRSLLSFLPVSAPSMVLRVVVAPHKRCAYVHVRCHLIQRYALMRAIVPLPHSSPHLCSNIINPPSEVAPLYLLLLS